jgi:tRNA(Ile)-lysidine synthase TilS/MesJ
MFFTGETMKLQRLYSYVRQAIDDYHMIEDGDRIAIGISGGKDSLTLLYALAGLRSFYPKKFTIVAVTVDLGYAEFDLTPIAKLCEQLQVEYYIVKTEIANVIFQNPDEKSPCYLCAKMRKGALNDFVKTLSCNKVAYAHHLDDIVETAFLSIIYEGRFYAFAPVTELDRCGLTVIRPLMYVPEADVIGFRNKFNLPVVKNPCPADGSTRREYVKQLLRQINRENPGAKKRMFHAIVHGNIEGWTRYEK